MSSSSKILDRMRHHSQDWRIDTLENVARHYGVNIRKSGGSHVVFEHPKWIELLCIPVRRPIKPVYIKKFVKLIDLLIEKENE